MRARSRASPCRPRRRRPSRPTPPPGTGETRTEPRTAHRTPAASDGKVDALLVEHPRRERSLGLAPRVLLQQRPIERRARRTRRRPRARRRPAGLDQEAASRALAQPLAQSRLPARRSWVESVDRPLSAGQWPQPMNLGHGGVREHRRRLVRDCRRCRRRLTLTLGKGMARRHVGVQAPVSSQPYRLRVVGRECGGTERRHT